MKDEKTQSEYDQIYKFMSIILHRHDEPTFMNIVCNSFEGGLLDYYNSLQDDVLEMDNPKCLLPFESHIGQVQIETIKPEN